MDLVAAGSLAKLLTRMGDQSDRYLARLATTNRTRTAHFGWFILRQSNNFNGLSGEEAVNLQTDMQWGVYS